MAIRVLIVEDELKLATMLRKGLQRQGYATDVAGDGEEALALLDSYQYDLVLLDILLPKLSGMDVCREMRRRGLLTPAIMLTAKIAVQDITTGLDAGADDYVTKPFSFQELLARMRAVMRRPGERRAPTIRVGPLAFDQATREVRVNDCPILLTRKESALLECLILNPGRVITRRLLMDQLWDGAAEASENSLEVHVHSLRAKLGVAAGRLETVRGLGYRLKEAGGDDR